MKANTKTVWVSLVSSAAAFMVARTSMETVAKSMAAAIVEECGLKPADADLDSLWTQLISGKANQAERKAKSRAMALAVKEFSMILPAGYAKASTKGLKAAKAGADKAAENKEKAKNANVERVHNYHFPFFHVPNHNVLYN
jgi:hypothetical protein